MSNILNTASIDLYEYEINPNTHETVTKGPISSTSDEPKVVPMVTLDKVCAPDYMDLGDTFTIDYILTNVDVGSSGPKFTSVTVTDPIFTMTSYATITTSINFISIDTGTGIGTVDLSSLGGEIDPGESITASVTFTVISVPVDPSQFVTTAVGTFMVSMGLTLTATDTCGSIIRNGDLTISKVMLTPSPVYVGQIVTYQITITNTGNVDSVIAAGDFTDYPPLTDLADIALVAPPASISFDGLKIYNTSTITLAGGASLVITFTARVI